MACSYEDLEIKAHRRDPEYLISKDSFICEQPDNHMISILPFWLVLPNLLFSLARTDDVTHKGNSKKRIDLRKI